MNDGMEFSKNTNDCSDQKIVENLERIIGIVSDVAKQIELARRRVFLLHILAMMCIALGLVFVLFVFEMEPHVFKYEYNIIAVAMLIALPIAFFVYEKARSDKKLKVLLLTQKDNMALLNELYEIYSFDIDPVERAALKIKIRLIQYT